MPPNPGSASRYASAAPRSFRAKPMGCSLSVPWVIRRLVRRRELLPIHREAGSRGDRGGENAFFVLEDQTKKYSLEVSSSDGSVVLLTVQARLVSTRFETQKFSLPVAPRLPASLWIGQVFGTTDQDGGSPKRG